MSRFQHAGLQAPGTYQVDVWLNQRHIDTRGVRLIALPVDTPEHNSAATLNTSCKPDSARAGIA
ncbi:FimD/PapC N-terminal domain-containing protein [Xanthomonas cassavae]